MKKSTAILVFKLMLILGNANINAQSLTYEIKQHAHNILHFDSLDAEIYKLMNSFRLIMIGEIHGTNEPVKFVESLTKLFTQNGDSVYVGFEIPENQMRQFIEKPTKDNILKTDFFSNPSGDGRASEAWYNALAIILENPKAKVFFFDREHHDTGNVDSVMYVKIKKRLRQYPNWKVITISGDIHNRVNTENNEYSFGSFLQHDTELNIAEKICSLEHIFKGGETLWNNFKETDSAYTMVGYDSYIYLYPINSLESYSGFIYTKRLTKSESAVSK